MRRIADCLLVLAALSASCAAYAQSPRAQGTVRVIVPFSAGGSTDTVTRVLAEELRRTGTLNIVVDNLPGATGKIGAEACARANPDGRILCLGVTTTNTLPLVLGAQAGSLDYLSNLVPVVLIGTQPLVISANPRVPARSVPALARWLKESGGATFSTTGIGSISHLTGLSFAHELGVTLTHIPFKGGESASLAAASGQVALTITQFGSILPFLANGRLVPVATTGSRRLPMLQDVPTLSEALDPRLTFVSYLGFFAPRGIAENIAAGIYQNFRSAVANPDIQRRLWQLGVEPDIRPGPAFAEFLAREELSYRAVLKTHGVRLD